MLALLYCVAAFHAELDAFLSGSGTELAARAAFPGALDAAGLGGWLAYVHTKPRSALDLERTFAEIDANADGHVSFGELTGEMGAWFGPSPTGNHSAAGETHHVAGLLETDALVGPSTAMHRFSVSLAGLPGSGKGTVSERLMADFGGAGSVKHISTGDYFRALFKNNFNEYNAFINMEEFENNAAFESRSKKFKDAKAANPGGLLTDDLTLEIVGGPILKVAKNEDDLEGNPLSPSGYILDGFPRSGKQAQWLVKESIVPDVFVVLQLGPGDDASLGDGTANSRMTGRYNRNIANGRKGRGDNATIIDRTKRIEDYHAGTLGETGAKSVLAAQAVTVNADQAKPAVYLAVLVGLAEKLLAKCADCDANSVKEIQNRKQALENKLTAKTGPARAAKRNYQNLILQMQKAVDMKKWKERAKELPEQADKLMTEAMPDADVDALSGVIAESLKHLTKIKAQVEGFGKQINDFKESNEALLAMNLDTEEEGIVKEVEIAIIEAKIVVNSLRATLR